jgi:hypothetical protein
MQFKWFPNKPTNRPERQSLAFHNADYGINHLRRLLPGQRPGRGKYHLFKKIR